MRFNRQPVQFISTPWRSYGFVGHRLKSMQNLALKRSALPVCPKRSLALRHSNSFLLRELSWVHYAEAAITRCFLSGFKAPQSTSVGGSGKPRDRESRPRRFALPLGGRRRGAPRPPQLPCQRSTLHHSAPSHLQTDRSLCCEPSEPIKKASRDFAHSTSLRKTGRSRCALSAPDSLWCFRELASVRFKMNHGVSSRETEIRFCHSSSKAARKRA